MVWVALALAVLALLLALKSSASASYARAKLSETESTARSALMQAEEAAGKAARAETFVKRLVSGESIDVEMIEEGRLFQELGADVAQRLIEDPGAKGLTVVDVRTEQEVAGGHIEGMVWIPIDQLQSRTKEVPKQGKVLVFCAAGGRSAAACDYLSSRGWNNVVNVIGGMSSYRGKTVNGVPATKKGA